MKLVKVAKSQKVNFNVYRLHKIETKSQWTLIFSLFKRCDESEIIFWDLVPFNNDSENRAAEKTENNYVEIKYVLS